MRKTILSTAVALFSLGIGYASAAETPATCVKVDDLAAQVQASAPDDLVVSMIADFHTEAAKVLVDFYNAQPPQSDYAADEVVILHAVQKISGVEHPAWVVALFNDGCKVSAGMFPSATIKQVMGSPI